MSAMDLDELERDLPWADAREMWQSARTAMEAGEHGHAVQELRRLVAIIPDHPAFLQILGNELREAGQTTEAEAAYRRVLAVDPRQERAHTQLGALLWDDGRRETGAYHFERALKIKDNDVTRVLYACRLNNDADDLDAAVEHLRVAVRLNPENDEAEENLATLLAWKSSPRE